jgi:hypothetical protein
MKAKTKLQKLIYSLSRELKPYSNSQYQHAIKSLFVGSYIVLWRTKHFCLECNHSWNDKNTEKTIHCPVCKKKLYYRKPASGITDSNYYGVITTYKGFQVERVYFVRKYMSKKDKPLYSMNEVLQRWIREDGKMTQLSCLTRSMSYYYDDWIIGSPLEVRGKSYRGNNKYGIQGNLLYPKKRILPILKRNGFKKFPDEFLFHEYASLLLSDNRFETLVKLDRNDFLKIYLNYSSTIEKYWNAVKMCIRYNYYPSSINNWFDYLGLLQECGKDIRSSKYILPENLEVEHNKYLKKIQKRKELQSMEEMKKEFAKLQRSYSKHIKPFKSLVIKNEEITIKPILKVADFYTIGKILHHCIYNSNYHKKKESLLMVAYIDDVPIETIEYSLKRDEILQSRGLLNKSTSYTEQIENLILNSKTLINGSTI